MTFNNDLIELQEYLAETGYKPLVDAAGLAAVSGELDVAAGLTFYVSTYSGGVGELIAAKRHLAQYGELDQANLLAAYNGLAGELRRGLVVAPGRGENEIRLTGRGGGKVDALNKALASAFDLSFIPDGRYAFLCEGEISKWVFLEIKTIKKKTVRRKAFETGKFVLGREELEPGVIEVRQLVGDTKRLCGWQKVGFGYQGEFLDELLAMSTNPSAWGQMYGRLIGFCGVCGKRLTDEQSRARSIGPDCFKRWDMNYWRDWSRTKMLELAAEKEAEKLARKKRTKA